MTCHSLILYESSKNCEWVLVLQNKSLVFCSVLLMHDLVKWSAYSFLECKGCINLFYIFLKHNQVHHLLLSCYFSHCSMVIFLFNLHDFVWHRLDELTSDCLEQKKLNDTLQIDLAKQEDQNKTFKKVIVPFPP